MVWWSVFWGKLPPPRSRHLPEGARDHVAVATRARILNQHAELGNLSEAKGGSEI